MLEDIRDFLSVMQTDITLTYKDKVLIIGMLLYAKTDEEVLPDHEYVMSGNKISVKTLDLNQRFSLIAEQLDDIALGLMKE